MRETKDKIEGFQSSKSDEFFMVNPSETTTEQAWFWDHISEI